MTQEKKLKIPNGAPQTPDPLSRWEAKSHFLHDIFMKFGTKGFSCVLNMNPKLIFPYDPPPPTGVGGGSKYHKNGFHPNVMKFGNNGVSSVLNTNLKLISPYEPTGVGGIIYHNNGVHPNLMKFGTIGFPGVLNTNPKLIFQYDQTPPSHRRGGGWWVKIS